MPKKDLIGPIVWALVKVPAAYHRLVLDIVDRLSGNEARVVHQRVAKALREKSAPAVEKPKRSGLRPVARAFSEGFEPVAGSPALFVVKKSVAVAAAPARKTSECLVGEIYWPRDPEIDRTLPEMQPETAAASITVYGPKEGMTCAQMFRTVINVGEDVPLDDVGRLLKECGHVPSLSQLEQMVVQQERVSERREARRKPAYVLVRGSTLLQLRMTGPSSLCAYTGSAVCGTAASSSSTTVASGSVEFASSS